MRRSLPPEQPCQRCGHRFRLHTLKNRYGPESEACSACECHWFDNPFKGIHVGSFRGVRARNAQAANRKRAAQGKVRCSCCGKVGAVPYSATDIKGLTFPFRPKCAPEGWERC